jgi:hypothetical protein
MFQESLSAAFCNLDRGAQEDLTLRYQALMRHYDMMPTRNNDETVYLVLNDFRQYGLAYCETYPDQADLVAVITDMLHGQYEHPIRVVALNTAEGWSADASEDVAREIMRRVDLAGDELPPSLEAFVDQHLGADRHLTLRLA